VSSPPRRTTAGGRGRTGGSSGRGGRDDRRRRSPMSHSSSLRHCQPHSRSHLRSHRPPRLRNAAAIALVLVYAPVSPKAATSTWTPPSTPEILDDGPLAGNQDPDTRHRTHSLYAPPVELARVRPLSLETGRLHIELSPKLVGSNRPTRPESIQVVCRTRSSS